MTTSAHPTMPSRDAYAAVPAELKALSQWVVWRTELRDDRPTKVPYQPARAGMRASSTNPQSWGSFEEAVLAAQHDSSIAGIGFVFTRETGYVGVDLDKCRDVATGALEPWAAEAVAALDSYTEVSPSGTGVHVLVRGQMPAGGNRKGRVEMYNEGRYFTITGQALAGAPPTIAERSAQLGAVHAQHIGTPALFGGGVPAATQDADQAEGADARTSSPLALDDAEVLDRALRARNGDKLRSLFEWGDVAAYEGDHSRADAALISLLAYWTQDPAQLDRLFRSSALMRPKWDAPRGAQTYGAVTINRALVLSPGGPPRRAVSAPRPGTDTAESVENSAAGDGYSEDALALAFAERHAPELRFVAQQGKWFRFVKGCWREDVKLSAFDNARTLIRDLVAADDRLRGSRTAAALRSNKTVNGVQALARSDPRLVAIPEQFDADPWSLNTPGGVVDLRTGALRPHRTEDYASKQTAVAPGDVTACPRWNAFLARVTGGDAALERFLQVVAGYCLTGSVEAHALFFLYGTGGNGKGVFLNTLTRVLGDYARVAPIDAFTASLGDRHPTELAMLRGARLVVSQETEEGRRWAEAKIKSITGGDPISARFMRGDFFTYEPQFKLVIAGNHRPHLRSVDEAIRRRFHLIPFEQTIPAHERDPELPEKLRAEWPGILAWAIEGCCLWLEEGLRPPEAVQAATAEYFTAEDAFQAWVDDCCTLKASYWTSSAELFASWKSWAERAGEQPGKQREFSVTLKNRGFEPSRDASGKARGYRGITVNPNSAAAYLRAS